MLRTLTVVPRPRRLDLYWQEETTMPNDRGSTTGLAIRYIEPGDGDPRHGTNNGYTNYGCRCAACRAANTAEYTRKRSRGL